MTDLSLSSLFMNAGWISKAVMLILICASIFTWAQIVDGLYVLMRIGRALKSADIGGPIGVLWPIVDAREAARSLLLKGESAPERRERIVQQIDSATKQFMADAKGNLDSLAIVSSVAPFVGLFGTACGIISSFEGIAATQDTSLTVVAPGIAEALAATAFGLGAAIPAAIGYNRLGSAFQEMDRRIWVFARAGANV